MVVNVFHELEALDDWLDHWLIRILQIYCTKKFRIWETRQLQYCTTFKGTVIFLLQTAAKMNNYTGARSENSLQKIGVPSLNQMGKTLLQRSDMDPMLPIILTPPVLHPVHSWVSIQVWFSSQGALVSSDRCGQFRDRLWLILVLSTCTSVKCLFTCNNCLNHLTKGLHSCLLCTTDAFYCSDCHTIHWTEWSKTTIDGTVPVQKG